jgi:DNA recombination protein RmuC
VVNFMLVLNFLVLCGFAFYIWDSKNKSEKREQKKDEQFEERLKSVAGEIAVESNSSIRDANLSEIKKTLTPFKEQLQRDIDLLQDSIKKQNLERAASDGKFSQQIDSLLNATGGMQEDAQNLTKALRGDSKQQGDWGEQILEMALEKAGLQENINYLLQPNYKDKKGNNLRPDAVILLPNERNIVIDSKVSLTAYDKFVNSEDEEEKQAHLKDHITSIKNHIKGLSSKNYNDLEGINAPDYLFIFVPIDFALSIALSNNWDVQTMANDNKIAFVTPINLIAILRIAENLWRLDKQNKNAENIASRAGLLFQKFSNFNEDFSKVAEHLNKAQDSYNSARSKLVDGDGNLFSQVDKLKELGAKTQKTLSKPKESLKKE